MLIIKKKSTYQKWYREHKQQLSQQRKQRYAEDAEYRERMLEASRRRRRGERIPLTPPDAQISFAQAAEHLDIATSTLREWRRKKLFPEPKRHNRALWFSESQVSLLKSLKDFFQKYRMPSKIKHARLKEMRAFILANWN